MKKFIEIDGCVFSIEDVICTKRRYSYYRDDNGIQKCNSVIYLTDDKFITIKEEYFDELKEILLNYKENKENNN